MFKKKGIEKSHFAFCISSWFFLSCELNVLDSESCFPFFEKKDRPSMYKKGKQVRTEHFSSVSSRLRELKKGIAN